MYGLGAIHLKKTFNKSVSVYVEFMHEVATAYILNI
jgi:hypothetical protein